MTNEEIEYKTNIILFDGNKNLTSLEKEILNKRMERLIFEILMRESQIKDIRKHLNKT